MSEQNPEFEHTEDTHPLIDFSQPPPKHACRQAAKGDVWAEDGGAGT